MISEQESNAFLVFLRRKKGEKKPENVFSQDILTHVLRQYNMWKLNRLFKLHLFINLKNII